MSVQVIAQTTPVPEDVIVEQTEQLEAIVDILTPTEEEIELQEQEEQEQQELVEEQQELITSISENIDTLVTVLSEENENGLTETATTNEILLALNDQVEQLNTMLDEKSLVVEAGASTVVTYGVFYVPLLLIIIGLWWFFKQFLTDFR